METLQFKIKPVNEHAGIAIYRSFKLNQLFHIDDRYISVWSSTIEEVFSIPFEQDTALSGVIEPFIITHLAHYRFATVRYDDDCMRLFLSPIYKRDKMCYYAELYAKHKDLINIVDGIAIID